MTRRQVRIAIGALISVGLTAVSYGQAVLTGNVPAGTYTYTNQKLTIKKVKVIPGAADRTLRVIVTNGSIVVGEDCDATGIDAQGADGANGINGYFTENGCDTDVVFATDGKSGGSAFSVSLTTQPSVSGPTTSTLDILVFEPILARGGKGGHGGRGNDERVVCNHHCPPPGTLCQVFGAGNGKPGGKGGSGATITIVAAGNLYIGDEVSVAGGRGGDGGGGGNSSYYGAGTSAAGAQGGNAGVIQISQGSFGGPTTSCSLGAGSNACEGCFSGGLYADGGAGGNGGSGGSGSGMSGANGGNAGAPGKVGVDCQNFGMAGAGGCNVGSFVFARGGKGGSGGAGGAGGQYLVLDPGDVACGNGYCLSVGCAAPSGGGNGGNAGESTLGGSISIRAVRDFSQSMFASISAAGGAGGDGGLGGQGFVSQCTIACGQCQTVTSGGFAGSASNGSKSGTIVMKAGLTLAVSGSVIADGGNGGVGGNGGQPGQGCCRPVADDNGNCPNCGGLGVVAGARNGLAGAHGGAGASIAITCGTFVLNPMGLITACGGNGGDGGTGSVGAPFGAGGIGGIAGSFGTVTVNGVSLPYTCNSTNGAAGTNGSFIDVNIICNCG